MGDTITLCDGISLRPFELDDVDQSMNGTTVIAS